MTALPILRTVLINICLCITTWQLCAQQLPLFTQYSEYQGVINPASINYDYFQDGFEIALGTSVREQWNGIPTSPKTQLMRGEYFYETRNKFSLLSGGYLINDKVGHVSTTGIYGRIASVLRLDDGWGASVSNGGLSVGLLGGLVQYRIDTEKLRTIDQSEDPRLAGGINLIRPDFGLGVSFYKRIGRGRWYDYFFAGISIPQILGPNIEFTSVDGNQFKIDRVAHYYGSLSYYYTLGEDTHIEFSSWLRWVKNVPLSFDFVFKYRFSQWMWVGAGLNSARHFHAEFGLSFDEVMASNNRVKLAFSYNPLGPDFTAQFGNTFEINLSYMIDNY